MSSHIFFAVVAVLAYVPLLVSSMSIRPWHSRQKYLTWFLSAAILWGVSDILRSTGILAQHDALLSALSAFLFVWTAVQFYSFIASVVPPARRAWLPLAYASLGAVAALAVLGQVAGETTFGGVKLALWYDRGIILMTAPVLALLFRSGYILWRRLGSPDNSVLYSQVVSLLLAVLVITATSLAGLVLWDRGLLIGPAGHIAAALLLSYALTEHRLISISPYLRRGVAWIGLGVVGAACYWLLLLAADALFRLEIDRGAMLGATVVSVIVSAMVYYLRSFLPAITQGAFRRPRPDYFQKLDDFTESIDGKAGLRQRGRELLSLVTEAVGCGEVALLFLDNSETDFTPVFAEPKGPDSSLSKLRLEAHSPLTELLQRERKALARENLAVLPDLRTGVWQRQMEEVESRDVALLVPLLSHGTLVAILALGKKQSGQYTVEDAMLLEHLTDRLAVVMEKGLYREQRRQYEEELSLMNRSSMIIASSLDVESTYDSLIDELKRMADINWAAVSLIDDSETYFLAVYSASRATWKAGDRIPIEGTPAEWLTTHRETVVEPDLQAERQFATDRDLLRHGFRSAVHIPLSTGDGTIGSLDLASRYPDAFNSRHVDILERIASQIATQIENSRLYGEALRMARMDELTGLYNRRAMNEMITREIDRCSRYGGLFSVIILDIDGLKSVNDNHGHPAGDAFLRHVGNTLRTAIRSTDRPFRYGGDEFAILLPQTPVDAAAEVAERVRQQLAANSMQLDTPVTASLGVAGWPVGGSNEETLMTAADAALYEAKKRGGNRSCRAAVTAGASR